MKKVLETLIDAARIYSQEIGIEFGIEKYAMLVMKMGKRHITDGMKLPNEDRIRMVGENTWAPWRLTPLNKWRWKKELRKNISGEVESYSRQNCQAETLLNTRAVLIVRYSGPFLKWTREELKQMDQERSEDGELPALKIVLRHWYNDLRTTLKSTKEDW